MEPLFFFNSKQDDVELSAWKLNQASQLSITDLLLFPA